EGDSRHRRATGGGRVAHRRRDGGKPSGRRPPGPGGWPSADLRPERHGWLHRLGGLGARAGATGCRGASASRAGGGRDGGLMAAVCLAASSTEIAMQLDIQHNRAAQRFEVEVEGAQCVLDYTLAEGCKVAPLCSYAEAWMKRHPEYADLRA